MPKAVSKKQYRFMMAILHGKAKGGPRGTPPKSVAAKYSDPGKDAPDQHGENRGGTWGEKHHAKHSEKEKKKLKKSFDEFYKGRAVGIIVPNEDGQVLFGTTQNGELATPGGHVDGIEDYDDAAHRELREETGLVSNSRKHFMDAKSNGNDTKVFIVDDFKGRLKGDGELKDLKFMDLHDVSWDKVRDCCVDPLKSYLSQRVSMNKSLKDMVALENLEKNISRQRSGGGGVTYEMTHGDALKLIGNGTFRMLKDSVKGMKDEDFKDIKIDSYTLSIRKHMNDIYSGRVSDGHKVIHHFQNRSLPEVAAHLMSVFEWYSPEDEQVFEELADTVLDDNAIEGGINELAENYKRHNIANIYGEMESIRQEIRNGSAVDIQQVEGRMMKLFDRMENFMQELSNKHNHLAQAADKEITTLESKLSMLQSKIEEISKKPETIEAFAVKPMNANKIHDENYPYLPKPIIEISPNGKIRISFGSEWTGMEKENFLTDLKAKVVKKT